MNKLSIAAFAAASIIGFGAVGSASAAEVSGFADINYDAMNSEGEEGNFRASGEIDVVHEGEGVTFRADLDLVNAHNGSAGSDLPGPTPTGVPAETGVSVEQVNISFGVPGVADMVSLTAGIFNSPHGYEGQDAPDVPFAYNGLIWNQVPSNLAGALATVTPNDMASVSVGLINARDDITGGALGDNVNDILVGVSATPVEGVTANLTYVTNNSLAEAFGDQFDVNVGYAMGPISAAVEYLMADPATGTGNFDDAIGLHAGYDAGIATVNARYEMGSWENGTDGTLLSLAVGHKLAETTQVRLDYSEGFTDPSGPGSTSAQALTVQFVSTF